MAEDDTVLSTIAQQGKIGIYGVNPGGVLEMVIPSNQPIQKAGWNRIGREHFRRVPRNLEVLTRLRLGNEIHILCFTRSLPKVMVMVTGNLFDGSIKERLAVARHDLFDEALKGHSGYVVSRQRQLEDITVQDQDRRLAVVVLGDELP